MYWMAERKDEQMTKAQIQDQQAFRGARAFYYSFNSVSLLVYLGAVFSPLSPTLWTLLTFLLFLLNIYFYTKCHTTSTKVSYLHLPPPESIPPSIPHSISLQTSQIDLFTYPSYHHCRHCKLTRPYRTKHCLKCAACISKFDHHCFWIGNCVGEQNHHYFYWFLATQTYLNIVFSDEYLDRVGMGWTGAIAAGMLGLGVGFCIFTGYLFVYHTLLVLTGQTTWEQMRRPHISYLKHLPTGYNPFSRGIFRNIVAFFCGNHEPKEWRVPSFQQAGSLSAGFNICQNEYYNCC